MVQLVEAIVQEIIAVERVAIAVVAVLEAVQHSRGGARLDPTLIDHPAKPIQADVLIPGVAVRFARLLDVGQLRGRLRPRPLDHGPQAEIAVALQRRRAVLDIDQPADLVVEPARGGRLKSCVPFGVSPFGVSFPYG